MLTSLEKTRYTSLSLFSLKLFAMLAMLASHISIVFEGHLSSYAYYVLYYLGRMAFPIFAFTIANGWRFSKNRKKYAFRIAVMALVSQVPFAVALKGMAFPNIYGIFFSCTLNIGFTFLVALFALFLYDFFTKHGFNKPLALIVACAPALFSELFLHIRTDYGYRGILLILIMYAVRNKSARFLLSCFVLMWICSVSSQLLLTVHLPSAFFMILSLFFIESYNGRMGRRIKYLFYIFYPAHLIVLLLLKALV